jgi:hypothetical protein
MMKNLQVYWLPGCILQLGRDELLICMQLALLLQQLCMYSSPVFVGTKAAAL